MSLGGEEQAQSRSYYEVLGLDSSCPPELLKARYRELAREHHPDQLGHLSAEEQETAAAEMAAINEAYNTLSDPHLRWSYDQQLSAEAAERARLDRPAPVPPRRPFLAWVLVALVFGAVIALWLDATRVDRRGFNENLSAVSPLLTPYVQKDRKTPAPSIKELMQSPEGTLIKRALQPEMTVENCLSAFPEQLQSR